MVTRRLSCTVMVVTHSQETCARILQKFLAQVSCIRFSCTFMQVLIQETFITNMADKADRDAAAAPVAVIAVLAHEKLKSRKRKRNILIQPWIANTGMQVSCMEQSCAVFGARNLYNKNLVQETMPDGQVSCTSRLVQVSCTSFLTACHHHN